METIALEYDSGEVDLNTSDMFDVSEAGAPEIDELILETSDSEEPRTEYADRLASAQEHLEALTGKMLSIQRYSQCEYIIRPDGARSMFTGDTETAFEDDDTVPSIESIAESGFAAYEQFTAATVLVSDERDADGTRRITVALIDFKEVNNWDMENEDFLLEALAESEDIVRGEDSQLEKMEIVEQEKPGWFEQLWNEFKLVAQEDISLEEPKAEHAAPTLFDFFPETVESVTEQGTAEHIAFLDVFQKLRENPGEPIVLAGEVTSAYRDMTILESNNQGNVTYKFMQSQTPVEQSPAYEWRVQEETTPLLTQETTWAHAAEKVANTLEVPEQKMEEVEFSPITVREEVKNTVDAAEPVVNTNFGEKPIVASLKTESSATPPFVRNSATVTVAAEVVEHSLSSSDVENVSSEEKVVSTPYIQKEIAENVTSPLEKPAGISANEPTTKAVRQSRSVEVTEKHSKTIEVATINSHTEINSKKESSVISSEAAAIDIVAARLENLVVEPEATTRVIGPTQQPLTEISRVAPEPAHSEVITTNENARSLTTKIVEGKEVLVARVEKEVEVIPTEPTPVAVTRENEVSPVASSEVLVGRTRSNVEAPAIAVHETPPINVRSVENVASITIPPLVTIERVAPGIVAADFVREFPAERLSLQEPVITTGPFRAVRGVSSPLQGFTTSERAALKFSEKKERGNKPSSEVESVSTTNNNQNETPLVRIERLGASRNSFGWKDPASLKGRSAAAVTSTAALSLSA